MKRLIIITIFGIFTSAYGQTFSALEKVLKKELPESSTSDGRWIFYADVASIQKIIKPSVKAVIPHYDFYSVNLTNLLGWHVNQGTCLILFDSLKSKIILVEPLWYSETSHKLVKLFIGKKFQDQHSLTNFVTELTSLMQVGSRYRFRTTSQSDTLITLDVGYFKGDSYSTGGNGTTSTINYNEDGIWRKIKIDLNDLAIIRYTEINPRTNDKEVIE